MSEQKIEPVTLQNASLVETIQIAQQVGFDVEAELTRILQEAIEEEFFRETGLTSAQRDQQIVDELVAFAKSKGLGPK